MSCKITNRLKTSVKKYSTIGDKGIFSPKTPWGPKSPSFGGTPLPPANHLTNGNK